MNGKKAKMIRRIANDIAMQSGLPDEKVLYGHPGQTAYVMKCAPAVANEIKKMVKPSPNLPISAIDNAGLVATVLENER